MTSPLAPRVVCTAGHVDHGKSALVRALTGTDPDRLAEERRRGLTIELGFAWTELAAEGFAPRTVAFVDLPGHERFVSTMLAGAGPVSAALLVVAADEGWMPQSAEHLAILDLLGVSCGVVALSKVDSVEGSLADLAVEEVTDALAGTSMAAAPIVRTSSVDGTGLDELRAVLLRALGDAPEPYDVQRPRLWIDRAFTMRGAGTVVTGTLGGGSLSVGDEVTIAPGGLRTRIRGLESLGAAAETALPGTRVALNLVGVGVADAPRGSAVVRGDQWHQTRELDARIRAVSGMRIGSRGAWQVHAGSAATSARLLPVRPGDISPDGADVRIQLDRPLPLVAGDRLVIRDAGPRATVGGGVVLDVDPPPRPRGTAARTRRQEELARRATAVSTGDGAALLAAHAAERGAAPTERALAAVGASPTDIPRTGVRQIGDALVDPDALEEWVAAIVRAAAAHHAAQPLDPGPQRRSLFGAIVALGCPETLAGAIVDEAIARGAVRAEGPSVALPEHRIALTAGQSAARDRLLDVLGANPLDPPRLSEAAQRAQVDEPLLRALRSSGVIVWLADDLALSSAAVQDAATVLRDLIDREGEVTTSRARAALGTSRRVALPLLELLDRLGVTRRVGDVRVLTDDRPGG